MMLWVTYAQCIWELVVHYRAQVYNQLIFAPGFSFFKSLVYMCLSKQHGEEPIPAHVRDLHLNPGSTIHEVWDLAQVWWLILTVNLIVMRNA